MSPDQKLLFLTAAYSAVWIITTVYLFVLLNRNRHLAERVEELSERLERVSGGEGSDPS